MAHSTAGAGPSTWRSAPSAPNPSGVREDLHEIQDIVGVLAGMQDEGALAAHAGRIRGAKRALVAVLEAVVGRGDFDDSGRERGEDVSSELEYVEPDVVREEEGGYREEEVYSPGPATIERVERHPEEAAGDIRELWREKWLLALNHIRECEAAQRRDRQELIAAIIEVRRAAARPPPTGSRRRRAR